MALDYLFECRFSDGTILKQTQADVSTTDVTKSAFYDVLQGVPVVFSISNGTHLYTVDLGDGHFEIDGIRFFIHGNRPEGDCTYRLIYFRRHHHNTSQGGGRSHSVEYHIGWQTTIAGENYQQTISLVD